MKILKITNKNETIHIMHEKHADGKKAMMLKITNFLTKDLRAKNIELEKELSAHNAANDNIKLHHTIKDILCNISWNNHKIEKIMAIPSIEKYNKLHDIEVSIIKVT